MRPAVGIVQYGFRLHPLLEPGEIAVDHDIRAYLADHTVHQRAELPPSQLVYPDRFIRDRRLQFSSYSKRHFLSEPGYNIFPPLQLHCRCRGLLLFAPQSDQNQRLELFPPVFLVFPGKYLIISLRHLGQDIHPVPFLDIPQYAGIVHDRARQCRRQRLERFIRKFERTAEGEQLYKIVLGDTERLLILLCYPV